MRNYFAFLLGLSLVCACGRDQLDASYLFDVYQSPAGQVVRKAEKECADLGLRFTSLNTIDASAEAQVALERPFLTYSGKMKALENYVRAVHEVEVVFATRTPAEMPARSRAALIKSGEIARTILALDKHGRGAIYSSDGERIERIRAETVNRFRRKYDELTQAKRLGRGKNIRDVAHRGETVPIALSIASFFSRMSGEARS